MAKKTKNLMALVLALSMLLSLMVVPAAAASSADQIVKASGTANSTDGFVAVTKTAAGTNTENVFDITLQVAAKQASEVTEVKHDAAVVLVVDLSNTMFGCCMEHYHQCITDKNNAHYGRYDLSRVIAANKAAASFVEEYRKNANGKMREIAIVGFATNGEVFQTWADVATTEGYNAVMSQLASWDSGIEGKNLFTKSYGHGGATNVEAGLLLASELLASKTNSSNYCILLSDGSPTCHINWNNSDKAALSHYTGCYSGNKCSCTGSNSTVDSSDYTAAENRAANVKNTNSTKLYSIAVAGSAWLDSNKETINGKTARAWLTSISDMMSTADNTDDLKSKFTEISNAVEQHTIKSYAKVTTVTDKIPSNIEFLDNLSTDKGSASISGDEITWTLNNTAKGTFTLSYRVRLKTEASGFGAGTDYPTNGTTRVNYKIVENGTAGDETSVDAEVPQVEGRAGTLTFKKISTHNNKELEGCTFTLTHNSNCACGSKTAITKTGTSLADGSVNISSIPSGHTYTLKETAVPSDYTCRSDSSTVTVSYGNVSVSGALLSAAGGTVTNTPAPKPATFTITKAWVGNVIPDGVDSVTVDIYRTDTNAKVVDGLTISKANGWKATVQLDTVNTSNKQDISYKVVERSGNYKVITGEATMNASNKSAELKNVITGMQNITLQKEWNAPADLRYAVTLRLLQDGAKYGDYTLSSANGWKQAVNNLPAYNDATGAKYSYSVVELDASGDPLTTDTIALNGHNYTVSVNGFTVTNALQQEYTSLGGTKTWNASGLSDAEKDALCATVTLYRNGEKFKTAEVTYQNTSYNFENLEVYDLTNNTKYSYTVAETAVSGNENGSWIKSQSGNNFTNTISEDIIISGTKTWVDPDESERPESITIRLNNKATGAEVRNVTLTAAPVMEGEEQVGYTWEGVNCDYSFTVPKYDATGAKIPYEIVEDAVDLYQPTYDGYSVTNTLNGGEKTISATKIWVDAESDHSEVFVGVFRVDTDALVETLALNENNDWAASVNLAKYENGAELNYYVRELDASGSAIADGDRYGESYTVTYANSADSWTVTNKIDQERVSVPLQKTWLGGGDKPEVTFTLYKNGVAFDTCTLDELGEDGSYTFSGLDKYTFSGNTCMLNVYTVKETMSGSEELLARYYYATDVEGTKDNNGVYQFVNEFHNDTTTVAGSKIWHGLGYEEEVWVGVFEGEIMLAKTETEEMSFSFDGLTKFNSDGTLKTYYVRELEVDADGETFVAKEEGTYYTSVGKEYVVSYVGADIHNTLKQEETEIAVTKIWRGPAADSVIFELYRTDDEAVEPVTTGETLTLTAADADSNGDWTGKFENLEVYNADRTARYVYSVKEVEVISAEGRTYTSEEVEANIFCNTVVDPENGTFSVSKVWVGGGYTAENGEAVKVQLYVDGAAYGRAVELNSTNFWSYTFSDLPLYNHETYAPATYSVRELDASGAVLEAGDKILMNNGSERYEVNYDDGTVINTFQDRDSYKYRVLRNYTYNYNGEVQTFVDDDTEWTTVSKGETISIDASQWMDCASDEMDILYDFVSENTAVFQGADGTYAFDLADGVVAFVTEKYVDGENWYEVSLFYTKSITYDPQHTLGFIVVTKVAEGAAVPATATFQLQKLNDEEWTNVRAAVEYSAFVDGTYTFNELEEGTYRVVESGADVDGYTLETTCGDDVVLVKSVKDNGDSYVSNAIITVTNIYTEKASNPPYNPPVVIPPVEEEEIPDVTPPTTDVPVVEEEIIEDEEVPKADVPATGDMSAIWAAVCVSSAASLMFVMKKKDKDED